MTDLSVLARVDFSSWPPVKNFDLKLTFKDADARLRPGMSAMARIVVGRLHDEIRQIMAQPEIADHFVTMGMIPVDTPSLDDLQAYVKSETIRWGKVVEQAGIAGSL